MIKATIEFTDKKRFKNLIRYLEKLPFISTEALAQQAAENTAETMKGAINASGYKLQTLANSIITYELKNDPGKELLIGIGKIAELPFYWQMFDTGFKPGAGLSFVPLGSFSDGRPDASKSGGKWNVGAGNYTFFDLNINKKAVEPLDYIAKGLRDLDADFAKMIQEEGGNIIKGLKESSDTTNVPKLSGTYIKKWGKKVYFNPNPGSASGGAR